jgi:glycosyltransferase involved in cell wall biosynthesis
MQSNPLFTVATITYNSSKYVRQAIESVLDSSHKDFEFIISDDSSTDDTWEIIKEYKDPRIKAWRNEINLGEYPNRNKVLNVARGKYLVIVDGDDILYKNTLRNLAEYLDGFSEVGMIWGVNPQWFSSVVLPYQIDCVDAIRLIYQWEKPISSIGFGEIVFNVEKLRALNGFSSAYRMGDMYIKKKMALHYDVLLIPIGIVFWRTTLNQASKNIDYCSSFIERGKIDEEILTGDSVIPEELKSLLRDNARISLIKNLFVGTILKFRYIDFFTVYFKLGLSLKKLSLILKRPKRLQSLVDFHSDLKIKIT